MDAIRQHLTASDFKRKVWGFLEQNPVENNFIMGVVEALKEKDEIDPNEDLLYSWWENELVKAIGIKLPGEALYLVINDPGVLKDITLIAMNFQGVCPENKSVYGREQVAKAYSSVISSQSEQYFKWGYYLAFDINQPSAAGGKMIPAGMEHQKMLTVWMSEFLNEVLEKNTVPADLEMMVRQKISDGKYFLWEDDEPVSMMSVERPYYSMFAVSHVYTLPGFRKKGYASNLIASVSQDKIKNGFNRAVLFADEKNDASVRLYRSLGFEKINEYSEYRWK